MQAYIFTVLTEDNKGIPDRKIKLFQDSQAASTAKTVCLQELRALHPNGELTVVKDLPHDFLARYVAKESHCRGHEHHHHHHCNTCHPHEGGLIRYILRIEKGEWEGPALGSTDDLTLPAAEAIPANTFVAIVNGQFVPASTLTYPAVGFLDMDALAGSTVSAKKSGVFPLVLADGPAFLTVSGTAGVYEDANVFVQNVGTVSAGQLFVCIHPPIFRE